jgi:DNA-binding CsgD family transcriptional regulator
VFKKTIILGTVAGILLFAYQWSTNLFLLSLNYWEVALVCTVLLFGLAGGAYVHFTNSPKQESVRTPSYAPALPENLALSPREKEVLLEICLGKSNKQIAAHLYISESTVKSHVSNLLTKFDAKSRTQIMRQMQALNGGTLVGKEQNPTKV